MYRSVKVWALRSSSVTHDVSMQHHSGSSSHKKRQLISLNEHTNGKCTKYDLRDKHIKNMWLEWYTVSWTTVWRLAHVYAWTRWTFKIMYVISRTVFLGPGPGAPHAHLDSFLAHNSPALTHHLINKPHLGWAGRVTNMCRPGLLHDQRWETKFWTIHEKFRTLGQEKAVQSLLLLLLLMWTGMSAIWVRYNWEYDTIRPKTTEHIGVK